MRRGSTPFRRARPSPNGRPAPCRPAGLFGIDLNRSGRLLLSLQSSSGMEHAADPQAYWNWLENRFHTEDAQLPSGFAGEVRDVYKGDQFRTCLAGVAFSASGR